MFVELSDEVCCNIVTTNKHINILSVEYYVSWPSMVTLKLKFQLRNRCLME